MEEDVKNAILFHIPHSRTLIPDYSGFNFNLIDEQIKLFTDFHTDDIFHVENIDRLIFPYSRIYCDVERFPDDKEIMYDKGRGIFYTKSDDGQILRVIHNNNKEKVMDAYNNHHKKLKSIVDEKINNNGFCAIIDCHSFPNIPFKTDLIQEQDRPDICIGVDEFHTPDYLLKMVVNACHSYGFSFKINNPYSGTMIPIEYYKTDDRVRGIMIEINRDLYKNNYRSIQELNSFINSIFG